MAVPGIRQDGDVVALAQHIRAARDGHAALAFHRTDQVAKLEDPVQLHDAAAGQNAARGNLEAQQLRMPLGKGADRQRLRPGENVRDLPGRLQLRVDDHGQAQLLAQIHQLLRIVGVAHARDGGNLAARLLGDRAAQQVQLVRARDSDDHVRQLDAGLIEHAQAGAVAADAHHVIDLRGVADDALVRVHNGDIMSLAHQMLRQRMAHLAAAHNDDAQRVLFLFRSSSLHDAFLQHSAL